MGVARAFVRGTGRVTSEHRPRLAPGQPHQIALRPAISQPVMRERVPQLVRVQIAMPRALDV